MTPENIDSTPIRAQYGCIIVTGHINPYAAGEIVLTVKDEDRSAPLTTMHVYLSHSEVSRALGMVEDRRKETQANLARQRALLEAAAEDDHKNLGLIEALKETAKRVRDRDTELRVQQRKQREADAQKRRARDSTRNALAIEYFGMEYSSVSPGSRAIINDLIALNERVGNK